MSRTRVQQIPVSLDGFATGEGQSLGPPTFGHAGERLHEWMFATRYWSEGRADPAAPAASTTPSCGRSPLEIGAEIMGAGKFGPPGWHETRVAGLVGTEPAVPHTDLRPHPSPAPVDRDGGRRQFHFLDAPPAEALETAAEAAGGQDVRIGGGPTTVRDFVAAGLVDHMHIAVVPILLGRGERLWDGLEGLEDDYEIEEPARPRPAASPTSPSAAGG